MVSVEFENNSYLLTSDGVWVGNGGPKQGRYPGLHCSAPMILWPELVSAGIEQGYDRSELIRKAPEKPAKSTKRRAKKPANSISIF